MKPPPDTPEFRRFTQAMKQILTVPKSTIDAQVVAEKRKRARSRKVKDRASAT